METQNYHTKVKRQETVKNLLNQSNVNNRFRSVSKTPGLVSKKDQKKASLKQNIPGFGAGRDAKDVKSAVRSHRVENNLNALNALKMKGSAINL